MSRPHFAQDPLDPLLTTREAAVRLGVSLRTVQLWVEAGTLPAGRTPGGHRRIRLSAVEALAQRSGLRAAAQPTATAGSGATPVDVLLVAATIDQLQHWTEALQVLVPSVTIRGANNGYTGLLQLGRQVPDLLITDLAMPDVDGYAMLSTLSGIGDYGDMRTLAITPLTPQAIAERGGLPDRVRVLHQPAPVMAIRTWVEGELVRLGRGQRLGA